MLKLDGADLREAMKTGLLALSCSLACGRIVSDKKRKEDVEWLVDLSKHPSDNQRYFFDALLFGKEASNPYMSRLRDMGISSPQDFARVLRRANLREFSQYAPALKDFFREAHDIAEECIAYGRPIMALTLEYANERIFGKAKAAA